MKTLVDNGQLPSHPQPQRNVLRLSFAVSFPRAALIDLGTLTALVVPVVTYVLLAHLLPAPFRLICAAVWGLAAVGRPSLVVLSLPPLSIAAFGMVAYSSPMVLAGLGLLIAFLIRVVRRDERIRLPHVCIGLLTCVLVISDRWPATNLPAPGKTSSVGALLLGLALLQAAITFPPKPRPVAVVIAVSGAFAAVYALINGTYVDGRLTALTLNANYLGTLLLPSVVAAVGLAGQVRRLWWLVTAVPAVIAICLTMSRGALLGVAVGVLLIAVGKLPRRWYRMGLAAVIGVLGVAVLVNLVGSDTAALVGRNGEQAQLSSEIRLNLAQIGLKAFLSHPLRGIGYGNFPSYAARMAGPSNYLNTHNDYLRLAAEAGLPALLLFLALVWLGIKDRIGGDFAILHAMVVAYAVNAVFINSLANPLSSTVFWVPLGCMIAAGLARTSTRATPARVGPDQPALPSTG